VAQRTRGALGRTYMSPGGWGGGGAVGLCVWGGGRGGGGRRLVLRCKQWEGVHVCMWVYMALRVVALSCTELSSSISVRQLPPTAYTKPSLAIKASVRFMSASSKLEPCTNTLMACKASPWQSIRLTQRLLVSLAPFSSHPPSLTFPLPPVLAVAVPLTCTFYKLHDCLDVHTCTTHLALYPHLNSSAWVMMGGTIHGACWHGRGSVGGGYG